MFNPADYLNDPNVLEMSLEARGAYSTLLFALWSQPEPGVARASDGLLSALARATADEWARVRDAVERAFDTATKPGFWRQKRMIETWAAQSRRHRGMVSRGRLGGRANGANAQTGRPVGNGNNDNELVSHAQAIHGTWYIAPTECEGFPTNGANTECIGFGHGGTPGAAPPLTLRSGRRAFVTTEGVATYRRLFPGVDVVSELLAMSAWCDANPTRRKTPRGLARFVSSWLSRTAKESKPAGPRRRGDADYIDMNLGNGKEGK